jgi:hypothetical protein
MAGCGSFTRTEAVAVLPVPPLVEVTLPVVLVLRPVVLPVTVRLKLQLPPAAMEPPLRAISPVAAVVVSVPPHWEVDESATVSPAGSVSVNATPVRAVEELGLLIENVRLVVLPVKIGLAVKDLPMTGGATTVSVAVP